MRTVYRRATRIPAQVCGVSTAHLTNQKTWGVPPQPLADQMLWHRACSKAWHDVPCFVYLQFDSAGTLLYVGHTTQPDQRESLHRSSSPWSDQIARTEYELHPNVWVARAHEEHAIKTMAPLYNVVHSPDRASAKARLAELDEQVAS